MAQFNVNLAFNADTGKAKTQIMELQSLLSKIAYTGTTSGTDKLQTDLHAASAAAKELQFHLNNAFNASTGNFDLSMLDRSLKTSGSNVTDLSMKLLNAGATGQQAFVKLAQSISLADQPMFRISKRMQEFAVTMKNTLKWQLSSSMLHGFMGAVQSAYGYAQDLNKSLNDIRIVTGYNTDRMAEFAEQANKAAKALSTTTTDYTNASLIYFQQGLSDEEVTARTDITVKMANAVGQSAETVSEQLTAVWNNFADGSQSLEYYVDVMTALGAATASSSDEISEGLSKFAAVASTVGLSYEYATAALTTLTSNTRESADVVGNALKTLFARIQGLQLGETLDDGTTLNKYSEALKTVGISIYNANGGLKDMDSILNEMAAKWGELNDTQQVALAQTVAGVRQYNQLIALMENWNKGDSDSMVANLKTIANSEGALQKQADIYAESWEAAEKRVQAAAEGIYQSLLDDKFFINLTNGFANILNGLDAFIEGAGGVKSILIGISGIIMSTFANKIPGALDTFRYNLEIVTKGSQAAYDRIQKGMQKAANEAFKTRVDQSGKVVGPLVQQDSAAGLAISQANELTTARTKLALVSDKMTNAEKQFANATLSHIESEQQEVIAIQKKNEALERSIKLQQEQLSKQTTTTHSRDSARKSSRDITDQYVDISSEIEEFNRIEALLQEQGNAGQITSAQYEKYDILTENGQIEKYRALQQALSDFHSNYQEVVANVQASQDQLGGGILQQFLGPNFDEAKAEMSAFSGEFKTWVEATFNTISGQVEGENALDLNDKMNLDAVKAELTALQTAIDPVIQEATGLDKAFEKALNAKDAKGMQDAIKNLGSGLTDCKVKGKDFEKILRKLYGAKPIDKLTEDMRELSAGTSEVSARVDALNRKLKDFNPQHVVRMSEAFGSLGGFIGNVSSILTSLSSTIQSLANPELSGWEKFTAVLSAVGMIIPSLMSAISSYATMVSYLNTQLQKQMAIEAGLAMKKQMTAISTALQAKAQDEVTEETLESVAALIIEQNILDKKIGKTGVLSVVTAAYNAVKASGTKVTLGAILAHISENMVIDQKNAKLSLQAILLTIIKALTGDWASILKVLAGVAIAVGVALAGWGLSELIVTQKEATQAIQESTDAYKKAKDEADSLSDTLQTTRDRIEELQSMESLSFVEQEELDKLLLEAATLDRELQTLREIEALKRGEAADSFEKNFKKSGKFLNNAPPSASTREIAVPNPAYEDVNPVLAAATSSFAINPDHPYDIMAMIDTVATLIKGDSDHVWDTQHDAASQFMDEEMTPDEYYQYYKDAYDNGEIDAAAWEAAQQYVENWREADLEARREWMEENAENQKAREEGFAAWLEQNPGADPETVREYVESIGEYYKIGYGDDYEEKMFNNQAMDDLLAREEERSQINIDKMLQDSYENGDIGLTAVNLANQFSTEFKNQLYSQGILPEDYADYLIRQSEEMMDSVSQTLKNAGSEVTLEQLMADERWDPTDLEALMNITITGEDTLDSIFNKIDEYSHNEIIVNIALGNWKDILTTIEGLTKGEIISQEDYDLLIAYDEELAKHFALTAEGYRYLGGIDKTQVWTDMSAAGAQAGDQGKYNEIIYNSATNSGELDQIHETLGDDDAYGEGLASLASQYEECDEALQSYTEAMEDHNEALEEFGEGSDEAIKSEKKLRSEGARLRRELKKVEWEKFTEDALDYASALEDCTNEKDVEKNLKGIQKAFKEYMGFDVSMEALDKYKDKFIDWANAGEEASDDIATEIYSLLQLEEAMEDPISVTADISEAGFQVNNIGDIFDQVKAYIESNGITVSATGQADLSGLVAELLASGKTAADVAAALKSIGQTQVSFDAFGSGLVHYDLGTVDGLVAFINDLTAFHGEIQTNGETPDADAIQDAFGGGGFTGSGGGRHNNGGNKGGGGGGSKKHAEKKDSSDDTRYHTILNQLEDLQSEYDAISEAADRAFGLDKLDLIDDQVSAIDDLIDKQKEYVDALAADVPVDKAVMDAYYDKVIGGPAMEFDENGNIANYDEIEAAMHAKYNEMADKYTDDSEEWKEFEKQYERMEKYIEDYEQYYDDLREAEAEYQDLINQRIDLQLQKVQYKVELELDVENDEMELLEYQLSLIEDDAFKSAEAITLLTKQAESLYDQIQVNKQGLNDALGLSLSAAEIASVMAGDLSVLDGKTFTEDQISAIRDYRDNLLELNEQFNEIRQSIEEQVMATFDAWQEKLERGSESLEHYGNILESYQNIVDIVGTDTLGLSSQFMADLSQAKVDNSIDQLEAAKSSYEAVSAAQKEAQEALAAAQAAGDEESISMWEETLITLNEEAQAASEELMAAWEDALSGIVEAFDMAVDRAVQDFNDAIYSLGGVEGLLDAFQNAQETSDLMLEDYQQIYELSKLSRDINNSIDDTENLAGKQKLKKLLGEINKLQEEGVEMSQYDLEYLQAEYQLRLAEIELEEAQNAKNTVRLQKDNEGNWSYVYTQNTDAVDEAQQKYEDALYSMQDLSSNYIDEMSEQLINTSQEMADALAAIRVEDFASIDDYYAEVERVQAQYQEEIAMQEAELQKAIDNNKELYDTDWTNYHNATGYKISDTEEFVTSFKDSLLGTLLDSESDTANFADILGQATASLTSNLMEAAATYYQNLDSAMEAAGTTTEGFAEDTKANIEAIVEASTTGAEAIDQMATEMTEAFSAITDSVTSWQETYGVAMQEIIDSNIAVIESFNDMIAALAIDEGSVTVKYDISSAPETDAAQFDTGGYTGTWGNAGKVAVLHEKELILNEDDTSNFLSAIQVTRAMLETIDLNAKQASMGVGNLVPSTVKDEVVQTLEQEVHITAEFPNVSDHNEVEEALKNLMNTASQYANRKS